LLLEETTTQVQVLPPTPGDSKFKTSPVTDFSVGYSFNAKNSNKTDTADADAYKFEEIKEKLIKK